MMYKVIKALLALIAFIVGIVLSNKAWNREFGPHPRSTTFFTIGMALTIGALGYLVFNALRKIINP